MAQSTPVILAAAGANTFLPQGLVQDLDLEPEPDPMVTREVKPLNDGSGRPPKGRMTWVGIAAIVLFLVALAVVILRPLVDRRDGPERGVPQVNRPAITKAGP